MAKSNYIYRTPHGKYQVAVGNVYAGSFGSLSAAKRTALKQNGSTSYKRKWDRRFGILQKIVGAARPQDHVDLICLLKRYPHFACSSGALYPIVLGGKEMPFRTAVIRRWGRLSQRKKAAVASAASMSTKAAAEAARIVHDVVWGACRAAARQDRTYWAQIAVRSTGWICDAQHLGAIRLASGKSRATARRSRFTMDGRTYERAPFRPAKHVEKVIARARFAHALFACPLPRTLEEYATYAAAATKPLGKRGYAVLGAVRSHYVGAVATRGGRGVRGAGRLVAGQFPVRRLKECFADKNDHCHRTARNAGITTVKALAKHLAYKRPLEYLAMDCCMFSHGFRANETLGGMGRALARARRALITEWGLEPSPAMIVKKARRG